MPIFSLLYLLSFDFYGMAKYSKPEKNEYRDQGEMNRKRQFYFIVIKIIIMVWSLAGDGKPQTFE